MGVLREEFGLIHRRYWMREIVYVFGHKNPDTDSVCSAIAYAHLKNIIDQEYEYMPIILGEPNKETQFVLEQVGLEKPKIIKNLKPQVSDLELGGVTSAKEGTSIKETLEKIVGQAGRSIPVIGRHEHLIGNISISDIFSMYTLMDGVNFLKEALTPFRNLISELKLELIHGDMPIGIINGKVLMYGDLREDEQLKAEDVLFCDYTVYEKGFINNKNAGTIILANIEKEKVKINEGETRRLFITSNSLCSMFKIIHQVAPIRRAVRKDNLEYFTTYETIEDVKRNMLTSKHRRFPVVDEQGYIKGMITGGNIAVTKQKKAILVDHNEKGQSIDGIEEIHILEVIDHHRVADIQTMGPLYFRVEPVGCTSTIVAKMYEENGVEINKKMAKTMLSAILSDTLLFKSPTSTVMDKQIARKLAKIANVDIQRYGIQVIYAGSDFDNSTPEMIVSTDLKRFMFGDYKIMIAQTNTSDFNGFFSVYEEILESIDKLSKKEEIDLFVLLVTDVIVGGTELIAVGKAKWIADRAFNLAEDENSIFLPNVFSRKKQIVPNLMKAARL